MVLTKGYFSLSDWAVGVRLINGWEPLVYMTEHGRHRGKQNRKRKEEEKRYFLIPPRESSPLLYPLWADSSEGPSTADGHLLHSRARERKKKKVKGLTSNS